MANIQITQLPASSPLTGSEVVPVVQNGVTVRTTTGAIASVPQSNYTYITVNQEPNLANSRSLQGGTGIGLTDGGAQNPLTITLNGASGSLEGAGTGFITKTSGTNVVSRTITAVGGGISVTNGDGIAGNPQISAAGVLQQIVGLSGTGILALNNATSVTMLQIQGTANQINVASGAGPSDPTISIAANPVIPGSEGITIPSGNTAARPSLPNVGEFRYNTDSATFEGYRSSGWVQILTSGGGGNASFANIAFNLANGSANQLVYQAASNSTAFVSAPTTASTFLSWNGSSFVWSPVAGAGTVTSVDANGGTTGLTFTGGPIQAAGNLTLGGVLAISAGGTGANTTAGAVANFGFGNMAYESANVTSVSNGQLFQYSTAESAWKNVDPGNVTVGTANIANTAIFATNAETANVAITATSANFATLAQTANVAITASAANFATLAETANVAITANFATLAQTANVAATANFATLSETANIAITATTANFAILAETANTAITASTSNFATLAQTANVAITANTANVAISATTANLAISATTANVAIAVQGGAGNQIVFQTASDTTSFITAPVSSNTFLKWGGSSFLWDNVATTAVTSVDVNGGTTGLTFSGGPITSAGNITMSGVLLANNGGTGQSVYVVGDTLYANATNNLAKLALGAQGEVLTAGASGPSWSGISGGTF